MIWWCAAITAVDRNSGIVCTRGRASIWNSAEMVCSASCAATSPSGWPPMPSASTKSPDSRVYEYPMRSSFFSRPPLRLIWKTENFMSLRLRGDAAGAAHVLLGVRHHVVELQAHLLADRKFRVAPLALARELFLQREHRLRARQRIERHAPLHDFGLVVGVDAAKPRPGKR